MTTISHVPLPMEALNAMDIKVIPVKSPQNGRGDWAHTNSSNVMTERAKPTWETVMGPIIHQPPLDETLNISEWKSRHVVFVSELHTNNSPTTENMQYDKISNTNPTLILLSIVGM